MEVITNVQKLYEIKKAGKETGTAAGHATARIIEVGNYKTIKGRTTCWCTLDDGSKYPTKAVHFAESPRYMTSADVGKTFNFSVSAIQEGAYVNLYAEVDGEAVNAPPSSTSSGTTYVGEDVKGKVRHGVVCAGIESGQLKCETREHCEAWVDFIMNGPEKEATVAVASQGAPTGGLLDAAPTVEEESIPF